MQKLNALTGLRFVASMLVVLVHFGRPMTAARMPILDRFLDGVPVCLPVFFALSGFVLGYSYSKRPLTPARFYASRLSRVCPLYFLALLLSIPPLIWDTSHVLHGGVQTVASLVTAPLLLQAWIPQTALTWNYPAWSVSVEVFFYALFPVWLRWFSSRSLRFILLLLPALWLLGLLPVAFYCWINPDHISNLAAAVHSSFAPIEMHGWLGLVVHNPLFHLAEFASGLGLSRIFCLKGHELRKVSSLLLWPIAAILVASLYYSGGIPYPFVHNGITLPLVLALIFCLSAADSSLTRVLGSRPLILLGEASYAIYILQYPVSLFYKGAIYAATRHKILGSFPTPALLCGFLISLCLISAGVTKLFNRYIHVPADAFFNRLVNPKPRPAKSHLRELNVTLS